MAELSPVLQSHRDGGSRLGYTAFPGSECESEAELSLSLARIKTRSYGSTASVRSPWAERFIEHQVSPTDTLQGIALKYGVTMEQIKRANKLFSTDCIFLRKSLNIPVISEKSSLFNGLNLLDSPENESQEASNIQAGDTVPAPANNTSPPGSPETNRPIVTQDEELSAKDFLHRLDLQIKRSTQAAKRLKEEEYLRHEQDEYYSTSSYQH
ncbi:PREDICTED: lysM and putative peptidoglycan-binding domain-containing protein 2 [Nanorana parkeri]|uniref:lysM and putative peptidoglycan-binding domain-containing protein 2 n=1 Tax=Nanorana parkeri TaxID=125878 RepID=UPI0008546CB0|nr:PREDICTED: lysM and putative peptidoglycan-binding domain-containing protein 2 [Nanorana parkeri]